ncbi:MAG: mechanosensitive ion channel family protein [Prevotella sp.]|jgi:small-conductance mechanosensitive channel|nr:mechanosensitive ion channel family protein [Prevotella sp.]
MRYSSLIALLLAVMFHSPSAQAKNDKKQEAADKPVVIDTLKSQVLRNAPVAPFRDTLFFIYGDMGAIGVEQRADAIEKNIKQLGKDPFFDADSLQIKVVDDSYHILYIGKTIVSIDNRQAEQLNLSKDEIAKEYRAIISAAIQNEQELHSWKTLLKQIGLAALILVITYLALKYLFRFFSFLKKLAWTQKRRTIKKLYSFIDAEKQISLLVWLLTVIRLFFVLLVIYLCLFAFFRLFPETVWLSDRLISYILSPLKSVYLSVKKFIPDLFHIIVIVLIFRYLIKALRTLAEKIKDGSITVNGFFPDWAIPSYNIVKTILLIFMFILIFPYLPMNESPAFQGISVFIGVLFSLGSTSVISNMVSGLVITYMRPFKVGDRIKMGEFLGNVVEKTPLVTRIKTPKNELITIPNANIMTAQTINYSYSAQEYGLILYETVTMGYETPWRKVHEALLEAAVNTPHVLATPKPYVLQTALDDFYVEYQINVYTKEADLMPSIYSDLNKNIQDVFTREKLELLSPHYRAQYVDKTRN